MPHVYRENYRLKMLQYLWLSRVKSFLGFQRQPYEEFEHTAYRYTSSGVLEAVRGSSRRAALA